MNTWWQKTQCIEGLAVVTHHTVPLVVHQYTVRFSWSRAQWKRNQERESRWVRSSRDREGEVWPASIAKMLTARHLLWDTHKGWWMGRVEGRTDQRWCHNQKAGFLGMGTSEGRVPLPPPHPSSPPRPGRGIVYCKMSEVKQFQELSSTEQPWELSY